MEHLEGKVAVNFISPIKRILESANLGKFKVFSNNNLIGVVAGNKKVYFGVNMSIDENGHLEYYYFFTKEKEPVDSEKIIDIVFPDRKKV